MNILSHLKTVAVTVFAVLAFASCTKEETSISINDLPGRAVVKGTVYYSNAQKYIKETDDTDAMLKDLFVPKGGVKVVATISNASITDEGWGYTTFETRTNDTGYYEFKIPVLEDGLEIELEALPFEGSKSTFDSLYRKEPKYSDKVGVFKNGYESVYLAPNDIKYQDIKYGFIQKEDTKLEEDAVSNFRKTILCVYVKEGEYTNYGYYGYPYFTTSDSQIEVKITDGNNIDKSLKTENGVASFEILHTTESDIELNVTVTSFSFQSSLKLPSYYDDDEIQGAYKQFCCTDEDWERKKIATVWENGFKETQKVKVSFNDPYKDVKVFMVFKPDKTNAFFDFYSEEYYQEWIDAYFKNN